MRVVLMVIVQVVLSVVVTASLMPIVLVTMPVAQEPGVGRLILVAMLLVAFALISLAWPARRRKS